MFAKIFDAIKRLFSSLFGGSSDTSSPTPSKPNPPKTKPEPIENVPQDGSEIKPDTLVVVANEMDFADMHIPENEADKDFDDDIFEDKPSTPTPPPPPPPPVVTPPPVVVTPPDPTPEKPADPPQEELPKPVTGHKARYLWCLDNGHGKLTKGKRSPVFDDGKTIFFEYEFNRDIVKRIAEQLDKIGVKYYITVPEVDIDDFLEGRVNRANSFKSDLPKLFVSVHSNAAPTASSNGWAPESTNGIETWFFHGSKRGSKMAGIFQKYLIEKTKLKNRHVKSKPDGQFYVLRKTNMTSVLTENGFYNNKKEAAELSKDSMRQKIADAHVAAILEIERDGL